ncbi:MAG: cation:proton antiporter [Bacillota bacterium]
MIAIPIVLLLIAWVFLVFGVVAVFRIKNLYSRILSAATIDTVASLTVLIALLAATVLPLGEEGIIFRYDYLIRFFLLIGFLLITNPISAHVNIRSAYITGVQVKHLERGTFFNNRPEEDGQSGGFAGKRDTSKRGEDA